MALLDLASRRWLLRIVWELRGGPMKFRALRDACDGVSPSLLNTRLAELRAGGLVELTLDGYRLTPLGDDLGVAFQPLSAWAESWALALANDKARHISSTPRTN